MSGLSKIRSQLFDPIDISSLVFFRIAFGLIMFWEVCRYFNYGWIYHYYIEPDFHFTYMGFEWVQPWPGEGMYWHFALLGLLSLMIMFGALYRLATILFLFAFTYIFLLEQARYLNHFYLVILFAFLLCVVPAHRAFSVDARLRPSLRSATAPRWSLWLMRGELEIVLLYAGLVKINADWLRLRPLEMWLAEDTDFFLIGPLFTETWVVALAAYGVILLHVVGAPLLLWRRTRVYVFALYCCFHVMNHFIFEIGIFPWFTIVASLLFFEPDWPRRALHYVAVSTAGYWNGYATATAGAAAGGSGGFGHGGLGRGDLGPGGAGRAPFSDRPPVARASDHRPTRAWYANLVLLLLVLWLSSQALIPWRHLLYPGNVAWTEEGHRFSWRMKLRDKSATVAFQVRDPATGETWDIDPRDHLTRRQARKMSTRPNLMVAFAHHLEKVYRFEEGIADVEVRAKVLVSLNGRRPQPMIDPEHDLTLERWGLAPEGDWILPLTEPLNSGDPTATVRE